MSWLSAWCDEVLADPSEHGELIRGAAARHLRDLERRDWAWRYDEAAGLAVAARLEALYLDEGVPLVLDDWQLAATLLLFGWRDPSTARPRSEEEPLGFPGLRRFQTVFLEGGKGMGKTPLMDAWGLEVCVHEGERRAEGYVFAHNFDQAGVAFRDLQAMVDCTPGYAEAMSVEVRGGGGPASDPRILRHAPSGSFIKRASTNRSGKGKAAPRPHFVLCEEFQEQHTDAQLRLYQLGTKSRLQPLVAIGCNSGVGWQSACGRERRLAGRIALGAVVDETYLALIWEVDDKEEVWDEANEALAVEGRGPWLKAQPSLPSGRPTLAYLRGRVARGRLAPAEGMKVANLLFGVWMESEGTEDAMKPELWASMQLEPGERGPVIEGGRDAGGRLVAGVDLAELWDLAAGVAIEERSDGVLAARAEFWMPEEGVVARELEDDAPYREWAEAGWLHLVPGPQVDFAAIGAWLIELQATGRLEAVTIDPYRADKLVDAVKATGQPAWKEHRRQREGRGMRFVSHPQGTGRYGGTGLWMPGSVEAVITGGLTGGLVVEFNPVLEWAALGCRLARDFAHNLHPTKVKSTARIDGFVALCMAVGMAQRIVPPEADDDLGSYWRNRGAG